MLALEPRKAVRLMGMPWDYNVHLHACEGAILSQVQTCDEPINVNEFEQIAREKLTKEAYDYYSSGAVDEITLRRNVEAYHEISLRPRMLVDVSRRNMETTVLGLPVSMPILIAPTAFHALAHPEAELATTRAAGNCGTVMTLSTLSNSSIEEVAAQGTDKLWFQLYVYKDREITRNLVERAAAAGYKALVLTVDSPLLGRRERDVRNRFKLPCDLQLKNLAAACLDKFPSDVPDSGLAAYIASLYDPALNWQSLEWICSISKMPLLVKGILRADDAHRAIECGARGIIVSNHGGRQLDTAVATVEALPEVVEAVKGRAEVFVDGGIRRGTDVLKAIALGARAVLVGRPVLWGLAAAGETGVRAVLEILRLELDLAMALSGCSSLETITNDLLARPKS